MIYNDISELIGNTPILKLDPKKTGLKNIDLYAKLEYMNPFGSLKDRVAKNMYYEFRDDIIKSNKTVLEASSGNTGKALALLTSCDDVNFHIVTNRMKISEQRMIMQFSNAQIEELPGVSDCPDFNDPQTYMSTAINMAKNEPDKYHFTDQYFNKKNYEAHEASGQEILKELGSVDYFFSTLGTTGSSYGVGKTLKTEKSDTEIYGIVAEAGEHLPGARNANELWEVGFFDKNFYKEILTEKTKDSILATQDLSNKYGITCGPTGGSAYNGAIKKLKEIDKTLDGKERKKAVFIACDRVESYLNYFRSYVPELFSQKVHSRPKVSDIDSVDTMCEISYKDIAESLNEYNIIDIRGNFAFSIGTLDGAINILDENFAMIVEEGSVFPKNKKILIMCRIGNISNKYAQFLRKQGYDAYSLEGGYMKYKKDYLNK